MKMLVMGVDIHKLAGFEVTHCQMPSELKDGLVEEADVLVAPITTKGWAVVATWLSVSRKPGSVVVGVSQEGDDRSVLRQFCCSGAEIANGLEEVANIIYKRRERDLAAKHVRETAIKCLDRMGSDGSLDKYVGKWIAIDPFAKDPVVVAEEIIGLFWGAVYSKWGEYWYTQVFCLQIVGEADGTSPLMEIKYHL